MIDTNLEERAGMSRTVTGTGAHAYAGASAKLMANPTAYRDACRRVLREWPNSCVAAFTGGVNGKAWLRHAACYLATSSPEECTRAAWRTLDNAEQYAADDAAYQVITEWRKDAQTAHSLQFDMLDLLSDDGGDAA